jgi:type I restriction enzyme S subunit
MGESGMKYPAYPEYKPSGVEWLGEVPEHWEVDRLKWMAQGTVNGVWGDEPNDVDDLICVRVADFDRERFRVHESPPTLRAVDLRQRDGRLLRNGDLLIEKSGGGEKQLVGCVVLFDHEFDAVCSNFVARMPIAQGQHSRFWVYAHAALYAGRVNYPAIKQTTGIQNLDSSAYLDTPVAFPPASEQLAIADFLDRETAKIDTLVSRKRTLIERLKEKRTALISRTVTRGLPPAAATQAGLDPHPNLKPSGIDWLGEVPEHWEVLRIKHIAQIRYGLGEPPEYTDDGLPFIRATDINRGKIDISSVKRVSPADVPWNRRPVLAESEILVVRSGAYTGDSALVTREVAGCIAGYDMVMTITSAFPAFVAWVLLSRYMLGSQIQFARVRAAQPHLNAEELSGFVFLAPSFKEQECIADFLDRETAKLDAMTAKVETAIERLQEYRTALITAAVTGKIDVRGIAA